MTNLKPGKTTPPKLARKILLLFLRDDLVEEVLGDLDEKFYSLVKNKSFFRTKLNYWYQVFNYLRPFAIRKSAGHTINSYAMFQNYFKITTRNLLKQKLYSVINIGGLAVGLACFIAIFLYVSHELSYDRHFENADNIYRVYQRHVGNQYLGTDYFAYTPAPLAAALRNDYPEIENATTIKDYSALLGSKRDHYMENGLWVDDQFFDVFAFPFLHGNPETALTQPRSIVLTESLAFKIFGNESPMGKDLIYKEEESDENDQDTKVYTVTGIIKDPPENTTVKFSFLLAIRSNDTYLNNGGWDNNWFHTFFSLADGASADLLQDKMPGLIGKYLGDNFWTKYFKQQYLLQPLAKIHMESNFNFDIGLKGNPKHVYIFSVVAVIILLLACVNYMNLAIARSMNRAREVGLRKVVGAVRWQLITQFLGESVMLAFLAFLLAIGMLYMVLPVFTQMVERPIELSLFKNGLWLPGLLLLVVVVGVLSGSYPAFFMSALRPVQVLKGKVENKPSRFNFQRMLIIGQYAVSIILVISSLVMYRQYRFIQQKELGYDREHVIAIRWRDSPFKKHYEVMKNEWLNNPNVIQVTASWHLPTSINSSTVINIDEDNRDDDLSIYRTNVDYDFLEVFGIELIAGRNFSRESTGSVENALLLNESAVHAFGWTPEEAIGRHLKHQGTVIGVVKDFHLHSMHLPIQPLMLLLRDEGLLEYISVKIRPGDISETLALLERTVKQYSHFPFEYRFLDDEFDQLYKADMRMGELIGFFTALSILITSMGLFGLAVFTASQRTKEIGIRKVLGASVQNIVILLTKDFLSLVALAFFFSIPIAWYVMHEWLRDFAYRIEMEWWMFAVSGILALLIANLAIGYQSLKASLMDPVDSLRAE